MGEISGYDRSSISGRIKAYPDAGEGQGSPVCSLCCAHRIWRSIKRDGTYYIQDKQKEYHVELSDVIQKEYFDEYEKEKLNENLRLLLEKQESRPEITVTFFVPDEKKDGGAYRTISGHIKRVDEESHCLILEEGERILLEDIFDLAFTAHEK